MVVLTWIDMGWEISMSGGGGAQVGRFSDRGLGG